MTFFLYVKVRVDWHPIPELLLSHALRFPTSASAKRGWLVTKPEGPWEGERKDAKPIFSFPPFARKFSSREKERRLGTRHIPEGVTIPLDASCYWKQDIPSLLSSPLAYSYGRYLSFFLYVQVGLECNQTPLVKLLFEESIIWQIKFFHVFNQWKAPIVKGLVTRDQRYLHF